MVVLLRYGGGVDDRVLPGLPNPGPFTEWLLPAARLGTQVFAAATVGLLLGATVLAPRRDRLLAPLGYRQLRAARWPALGWAVSSVALLCLTISDLLGRPVGDTVSGTSILTFISSVDLGRALALSAILAMASSSACSVALRPTGALIALVLALVAVTPGGLHRPRGVRRQPPTRRVEPAPARGARDALGRWPVRLVDGRQRRHQ